MAVTTAVFVLALVFLVVVAPVWIILNFLSRNRTNKMLTKEDEQLLNDLWRMAREMANRINTIETILDGDNPNWRKRI